MKNNKSFFSWQGNQHGWDNYWKWIIFASIFCLITLIHWKKERIKHLLLKDENKTNLYFRILGFIILVFQIIKFGLYVGGGYPLYWEHLMLHICRIHILIIAIALIINKKEIIMYLTPISIFGASLAILFGELTMGNVIGNKKELFKSHNIKYYDLGPDNFFFYDFFLLHTFIFVFPIFLWTGYSWKPESKKIHISAIMYFISVSFIWSLNYISDLFFPIEWKMNNWYIGTNQVNDYNDALGWLSGWPQNLFSSSICILILYSSHYTWMYFDKKSHKAKK